MQRPLGVVSVEGHAAERARHAAQLHGVEGRVATKGSAQRREVRGAEDRSHLGLTGCQPDVGREGQVVRGTVRGGGALVNVVDQACAGRRVEQRRAQDLRCVGEAAAKMLDQRGRLGGGRIGGRRRAVEIGDARAVEWVAAKERRDGRGDAATHHLRDDRDHITVFHFALCRRC